MMTRTLAELTTLEVGGEALELHEVDSQEAALAVWQSAQAKNLPLLVLGGGSNVLISDQGFPGVVLRWMDQSLEVVRQDQDLVIVKVGGGWVWDDWVAYSVQQNWAGLECLSGIPGQVGAAPIQNIGAYGQEVAECIIACWVLHWESGRRQRLQAADCQFGYRQSRFKRDWRGQYLVTAVEFGLRPGGRASLRYKELQEKMQGRPQDLAEVRQVVRQIRRSKSMLWDLDDPNHRSAGSFFVNPVVDAEKASQLRQAHPGMPEWPAPQGVKLSAAWLIENSGFSRGYTRGPAGLSSNHVLALINRGDAKAQDLVDLAAEVRQGVYQKFAVRLSPEPEFIGFSKGVEDLLA
jgi:UDP-N-acetylmuramate dehydrogenase